MSLIPTTQGVGDEARIGPDVVITPFKILPPELSRRRFSPVPQGALLIVDEVGFQPLSRLEASLFFRVVPYRYQRGSILITTNKAVKDWAEVLAGDETGSPTFIPVGPCPTGAVARLCSQRRLRPRPWLRTR